MRMHLPHGACRALRRGALMATPVANTGMANTPANAGLSMASAVANAGLLMASHQGQRLPRSLRSGSGGSPAAGR
jgi:hypothetical protein